MVICLQRGADLHMAQLIPLPLTVSCFSKIQIGFTFLVPAHPGSPGQRAVKRVCACVYREKKVTKKLQITKMIYYENFFSVIQKCFHHTKASILVDLVLPSTKGQFQYQAKRLAGKNIEWDVKPQLNQQTKRKLHKYCCDIKYVVSCSYTVLLTSNNYHDTAETP